MNTQTGSTVQLKIDAGVAVVTLNRPEKLNSFTAGMHEELRQALDRIERAVEGPEALRALVLTGAGRAFCAGQDLSERKRAANEPPPDLGASLRKNYNPLVQRISVLPVPVIAAVNGVAAGSGANLALACDIVIAARSAVFVQSFCRVGLIPDAGGTWILPRLVGMARAKGLSFLGERLAAETAVQWGLIWQVVDDAELMNTAQALARQLVQQPTRSFGLQKRAFVASLSNNLAEQLELEAQCQALAAETDDYREGVTGFFEKREPHFVGR
jgi:2-(1,2-epoxy-1,2-dihydrophenyl)acetyl-CoA isomerase